MERTIIIDGVGRPFKASGLTPRLYRGLCGRDLFRDIIKLETELQPEDNDPGLLMIYEDLAYVMAMQGNDALSDNDERKITRFPETPEKWLDGLELFAIADTWPEIARLFYESTGTIVESKKKKAEAVHES